MELNTQIFTLARLMEIDIEPFDAVYLGDPFALEYPENLTTALDDLEKAVEYVKSKDKKVYLSTFAVPRNIDLPAVERLLKFVAEKKLRIDMVEAHNAGVIRMIREHLGDVPVHMGCLSNIYTDSTAALFKSQGVKRITCNHELSLNEMELIKKNVGIEVEILVHGRMVLGVSEECPAIWWEEEEVTSPDKIAELCRNPINLESDRMDLTVRGRVTMSGKDVSMIEHFAALLKKGFDKFRIEISTLDPEKVKLTAGLYREVIELAKKGKSETAAKMSKVYADRLLEINPHGLCNGYFFGKSGSDYITPEDL